MRKRTLVDLLSGFILIVVLGLGIRAFLPGLPEAASLPAQVSSTLLPTETGLPLRGERSPWTELNCDLVPAPASVPRNTAAFPALAGPEIVYPQRGALYLAQWLPDHQRVLLTRDLPGTNRQAVEILNPFTGAATTISERNFSGNQPVWIPTLEMPAYLDWAYIDQASGKVEYTLFVGDQPQVSGIATPFLGNKGDDRLLFFTLASELRPQEFSVTSRLQTTYERLPETDRRTLQIAPRPHSAQTLYFNQTVTLLSGDGQTCRLDLAEPGTSYGEASVWALEARWSPSGQYLALITTLSAPEQPRGSGAAIRSTDLVVLDFEAGTRRRLEISPEVAPGHHYVTDLAWGADEQFLAALGILEISPEGDEESGLFLVEIASGSSSLTVSGDDLGGGVWGSQLIWSPDGKTLLAGCPTATQGRLCRFRVEMDK